MARPAKTMQDMDEFSLSVAMEVELLTLADARRGAKTRAIDAVAKKYKRKPSWVKKTAQRRPMAAFARFEVGFAATKKELRRRLSGLPADVRARLLTFSAAELLDLLRRKGIDGTAPAAFVAAIRSIGDNN